MTLSGAGALGVWHDAAPGKEATIEAWYDSEHHRERAAIDGFLRARRYLKPAGGPRFFSRYDVTDVSVLASKAYLAALDGPNQRSQAIFPHYRNTERGAFRVVRREGAADGGALLSIRLPADQALADEVESGLSQALDAAMACPGAVRAELWRVDVETTSVRSLEKALRGTPDAYPGFALLVDFSNEDLVEDCLARAVPPELRAAAKVDRMGLAFQLCRCGFDQEISR